MNILALDTVSQTISVSAQGPNGRFTSIFESTTQHAETLIDLLDTAIHRAGFTPVETQRIVCAEGPGSFTGLRIAYAAAKGIQLAADCPLVPVPTLPCYTFPFRSWKGTILSVMDAKKNRFYSQLFTDGNATGDPQDCTAGELMSQISTAQPLLVTGPDAMLFCEALDKAGIIFSGTVIPYGKAGISRELIEIALTNPKDYTQEISDYAGPRYVRKSDAETNTRTR